MNILKNDLMKAVESYDIDLILSLVQQGGDINYIYENGDTFLIKLLKKDYHPHFNHSDSIAEYDPNIDNDFDLAKNIRCCELIVKICNNINYKNYFGRSALFYCRNLRLIKYLISFGADVNIKSNKSETLLIAHTKEGNQIITHFLLNKNDIHEQDNSGNTALYYAICNLKIETIKLLIKKGAKMNNKMITLMYKICNEDIVSELGFKKLSEYIKEKKYKKVFELLNIKTKYTQMDDTLCEICYISKANVEFNCTHRYCEMCYLIIYHIDKKSTVCAFCSKKNNGEILIDDTINKKTMSCFERIFSR